MSCLISNSSTFVCQVWYSYHTQSCTRHCGKPSRCEDGPGTMLRAISQLGRTHTFRRHPNMHQTPRKQSQVKGRMRQAQESQSYESHSNSLWTQTWTDGQTRIRQYGNKSRARTKGITQGSSHNPNPPTMQTVPCTSRHQTQEGIQRLRASESRQLHIQTSDKDRVSTSIRRAVSNICESTSFQAPDTDVKKTGFETGAMPCLLGTGPQKLHGQ